MTRAINAALPDYLGLPGGDAVARLLDQLTDRAIEHAVALDAERPARHALPDELRLASGDSAYRRRARRLVAFRRRTTSAASGSCCSSASADRDGAAADRVARVPGESWPRRASGWADQATAIRGITSGARVRDLVGPAGTGKSLRRRHAGADGRTRRRASGSTRRPDRRCSRLATSQMAMTGFLSAEG
ncbi:hypothetical protein HBB16_17455 [Pseudonocardia sp. MCCB 268]|nr:hypothetical protein [Pseudonocardia cytotoxica]